jgi:formiminoglutamase
MTQILRAPVWPDTVRETAFVNSIVTRSAKGCGVALIGLADDLGVRLNHGRPGAAEGPYAFRSALARYGTRHPSMGDLPKVFDAGDVVPGMTLEETHSRVTRVARSLLEKGMIPVGIGGGHDLTFPLVRALAEVASEPLTGVYFDAHLDVRSAEGSGMSFRRLVEECGVRRLHVFGLDPFVNSAEDRAWFTAHGGVEGGFGWDGEWPEGPLFVSLDLDVLDQAFAPGVSAMNPAGWSPQRTERWAEAAGRHAQVRCFDIMELAPRLDETGRTARLAARLFLAFLRGVAMREGGG